ncbi:unnamed protein product [Sphagnum troendelagicum]
MRGGSGFPLCCCCCCSSSSSFSTPLSSRPATAAILLHVELSPQHLLHHPRQLTNNKLFEESHCQRQWSFVSTSSSNSFSSKGLRVSLLSNSPPFQQQQSKHNSRIGCLLRSNNKNHTQSSTVRRNMTKILGLQNRRTCSSCTSTDQGLSIPEKEEDDIEDKDKEMDDSSSSSSATTGSFTVEDAIKEVGFGPYQGWLLAYAGMSWVAEAMEMMLLSFVGPAVQTEWGLSSRQESLIASIVFVGMMIGAYSWGILSDLKGRRFGFFATAVLTFVAGLASAASPNYLSLLLLRGFVGIGLGGGPVISAWFMEFVPSANRGLWMVIISLFWTLGSIAEASLAWVVMPSLGWRWLLSLSSVPLAVLLLFYKFVPESPRYLAAQGETTSAVKILQQMARMNQRSLPLGRLVVVGSEEELRRISVAQQQQQATQEMMTEEEEEKIQFLLPAEDKGPLALLRQVNKETSPIGGVLSSFTTLLSPPLISSTILLWSVFFANAFTYYGLVLLTSQLSGQGGGCDTDLVASSTAVASTSDNTQLYRDVFVSSIGELPGLAVAAAIVDKLGRKWSMAALFGMCGVFLLPLVHPQPENLTILFLFGGRACIMGAFTVLYIYAPEIYPTSTRSTGLGIANSFARVGGIVCPLVAVDLVRSCQQGWAVSVFAGVPLLAAVAVLFFPMETTGQPLSDVVDRSPAVGRK